LLTLIELLSFFDRSFPGRYFMLDSKKQRLAEFTDWVRQHIKGDEKGEAQLFLDRFFQSLGHKGIKEAGATLEMRIKKTDAKGTAFADLVWKPIVLIEMKKRGTPLQKHYRQAFDYWTRLVPDRPRYVILCNFDEFWVYDFETQMDTPVDQVPLADLPTRYGPLNFLFAVPGKPIFGNDHEAVTRLAADALATCFNKLVRRKVDREEAQRFILQMLVALFSEDIDLLPKYLIAGLLDDCKKRGDSYDLLGGLFHEMNTPGTAKGGRFKGVDYFNGGLFAQPVRLELHLDEVQELKKAAQYDWSKVRPEIFGTLFEHSLDQKQRHALGQHFTSPVDIMKIVQPTIVQPWKEAIEGAKNPKQLRALHERLHDFTVLDPACGSGNFLYIAYRELKRIEARIVERLDEMVTNGNGGQQHFGFLTARNFFGMDISPFAIELAKVTMMIARKLAIDELHITEDALPLDNLDANFMARDALIDEHGKPAEWPRVDVVIGNPPFLGAKKLKPERGPDYVNLLRAAYPEVPGMADYCVYWFRRTHDHLATCTEQNPFTGRAGLVGTQNIRNNQSRVGGLDQIARMGTITDAVENQPWSGEANVHVSIANWVKSQDPSVLPKARRLWFKVDAKLGKKKIQKRGEGPASKEYELDSRECAFISSALSDEVDVTGAIELLCNKVPQRSFNGQMIGHHAFLVSPSQRRLLLSKDPRSEKVVWPYLNGREVLTGERIPSRFVIDFGQMDQFEASRHTSAFEWVQKHVLADRERKASQGIDSDGNLRPHHKAFLNRWWQLSFGRAELVSWLDKIPRYLCCSLVTKRPIFVFVSSQIRPSNLLQVFTYSDDYSFGILQSYVHWFWFKQKSSKLKSDYRFGEAVWNTFPWPQSARAKNVEQVARAGRTIRSVRVDALKHVRGGLRALYRTLELPGKNALKDAHAALDEAVLDAYGFSNKQDLLAQLLELNCAVAERIRHNREVVSPGVPKRYPRPDLLVTDDCVAATISD
jgi:hypothetical protein